MRFINSYLNVEFSPNVTMRTAYMNSYPRILIVAMRDIQVGEEFLLDYGEDYNNAWLNPTIEKKVENIEAGVMESELPGGLVEEDER
jgi:SET domain-containing protein